MKRGDYVQYWFDTGAMGTTILYGVVITSGPKTYTVEWESGIKNRLRQNSKTVQPARDQSEARRALHSR